MKIHPSNEAYAPIKNLLVCGRMPLFEGNSKRFSLRYLFRKTHVLIDPKLLALKTETQLADTLSKIFDLQSSMPSKLNEINP